MSTKENYNMIFQRQWNRNIVRYIRGKNLFIIRELVQFICLQEKVKICYYYYYLFNDLIVDKNNIMKKCRDRYDHMLFDTGVHNLELIKHKFIECGISEKYFDSQPIKFSDNSMYSLKAEIDEYSALIRNDEDGDNYEGALSALRESIASKYNEILNIDGSPMIDSIRILVNNVIRYKCDNACTTSKVQRLTSKEVDTLAQIFTDAIPVELYNDNQYKKIYSKLLASYSNNRELIVDEYVKPVSDKNIYKNIEKKVNIQISYMLIRTAFNILCEIDNVIDREVFYLIVGMTHIEYDFMISSGIADNKMLSQRLLRYHFPVNMFRGDNPKCVRVHPKLKEIAKDRIENKCSEEEYVCKIREQLFYVNHKENARFMISVYSMYEDVLFPREE